MTPATSAPPLTHRAYRLSSIDMLRGLVMVIMAIDHTRDFFLTGTAQDPTTNPAIGAALFATRWITHFCAPVFVLLAGVSAGLMTARKSPNELTRFLFTRGLWLIFVEIFIISTLLTFSPLGLAEFGGRTLIIMQVLWAIGISMILLSVLQRLGRPACLALGAAIVATHNLLDAVWPATQLFDLQWPAWVALHSQMSLQAGPFHFAFAYPFPPWTGIMLLGFGASRIFEHEPTRTNTILLRTGATLTLGFLLLRASGLYGDPNPWQWQPSGLTATVIDFLNVSKYPPSLLFVAMTLGPSAILCALAGRAPAAIGNALILIGRVPFAFYVAHFFLLHVLSIVLGVIQGFHVSQMMTLSFSYPQGYGVGLPGVYLVWAAVIVTLFPFCRWVANIKARRREWWLSFV